MTDTIARLAGPVSPSKAEAGTTVYNPSAGVKAAIKSCMLTNHDPAVGAWVHVSIGDVAVHTNRFISNLYVPPAKTLVIPVDVTVDGDTSDDIRARQVIDTSPFASMLQMAVGTVVSTNSTTDGAAFASASWAGVANTLYVLTVINTHATAAAEPTSITDTHTGLTWVKIQTGVNSTGTGRITQYRGQTSGVNNVATTVNFAGAQTSCYINISSVTGGDVTGTNGDEGLQGAGVLETLVVSGSAVPTAFSATDMMGGRYYAIVNSTGGSFTAATGYAELIDAALATPTSSVEIAYALSPGVNADPTPNGTLAANSLIGFVNLQPPYEAVNITLNGVEVT